MELQLKKQQKEGLKANPISRKARKFVGVRQRASGKWVAEIKNTTQKIRMWLGTFDTAEEAAQAYDEAACLLRGSNTRTNFVNHVPSSNPALSLKIRNLLNQKKTLNQTNSLTSTTNTTSREITTPENTSGNPDSSAARHGIQMFPGAYKPDLSCFYGGFEMGSSQFDHITSTFTTEFDRILSNQEDGLDQLPKAAGEEIINETCIPEFEHMKVERQISASLYAMNGVDEYWDSVLRDRNDAFCDLQMLYQMFCKS